MTGAFRISLAPRQRIGYIGGSWTGSGKGKGLWSLFCVENGIWSVLRTGNQVGQVPRNATTKYIIFLEESKPEPTHISLVPDQSSPCCIHILQHKNATSTPRKAYKWTNAWFGNHFLTWASL